MAPHYFIVTLFALAHTSSVRQGSVFYDVSTGIYTFQEGLHSTAAAYATFVDGIFSTGWSQLAVTTNDSYADEVQAYAAGAVEGYLTYGLIHNHYVNTVGSYCSQSSPFCSRLNDYLDKQDDWIRTNMRTNNSDYWHQVLLVMSQLQGIEWGYNKVTGENESYHINFRGFILMNLNGDLEDLEPAFGASANTSKRITGGGSCSSLIKPLPGMSDLLVSHDMWGSYQAMLRIFKLYNFAIHLNNNKQDDLVPGHKIAFSSYPATVVSLDDFYMLSSGMAILETTIGNFNDNLWKCVTPETLSYWTRIIVANRISTTGQEWCETFELYNSGTYNNEVHIDFV
jgi:hypothetical protein